VLLLVEFAATNESMSLSFLCARSFARIEVKDEISKGDVSGAPAGRGREVGLSAIFHHVCAEQMTRGVKESTTTCSVCGDVSVRRSGGGGSGTAQYVRILILAKE
jgi:hypothetical protein